MNRPLPERADASPFAYQCETRGHYTISTDPARREVDAIHAYLSRSYWATNRPREIVELSLRHSLNFGVYFADSSNSAAGETQIGFARIVTDYALFAYLCDVYILEEHRGHGLGKWLVESVVASPALQSVTRFMLVTRDAHGLYAKVGFAPPRQPENLMVRIHSKAP
jgi:GNAT superfamily N-acetyltransferase